MASGDTLLIWTAQNYEPPDASFAYFDGQLTTSADTPDDILPVLRFEESTMYATFSGIMPSHYAGTTGVTLTIIFMADGQTTGNVKWDAAFKSITDNVDNLKSKIYGGYNTSTDAVAGTDGITTYTTITFTDGTDMDSVAANEYFRLSVSRDGGDAGDTLSGDCFMIAVLLKET